jgi:Na+/melibiose symporter-like transporter
MGWTFLFDTFFYLKDAFICILCIWMIFFHICMCTTYMSSAHRVHNRHQIPWNWSYGCLWETIGCWEPNPGLLQEQQEIWTAEPFLLSLLYFFLLIKFSCLKKSWCVKKKNGKRIRIGFNEFVIYVCILSFVKRVCCDLLCHKKYARWAHVFRNLHLAI